MAFSFCYTRETDETDDEFQSRASRALDAFPDAGGCRMLAAKDIDLEDGWHRVSLTIEYKPE